MRERERGPTIGGKQGMDEANERRWDESVVDQGVCKRISGHCSSCVVWVDVFCMICMCVDVCMSKKEKKKKGSGSFCFFFLGGCCWK